MRSGPDDVGKPAVGEEAQRPFERLAALLDAPAAERQTRQRDESVAPPLAEPGKTGDDPEAALAVAEEEVVGAEVEHRLEAVAHARRQRARALAPPLRLAAPQPDRILDRLAQADRDHHLAVGLERQVEPARAPLVLVAVVAADEVALVLDLAVPHRIGLEAAAGAADGDGERRQRGVGTGANAVLDALDPMIESEVLERQPIRFTAGEEWAQPQLEPAHGVVRDVAAEDHRLAADHQDLAADLDAAELVAPGGVGDQLELEDPLMALRHPGAGIARHRQREVALAAAHVLLEASEEAVPLGVPVDRRQQQAVISAGRAQQHGGGGEAAAAVGLQPLAAHGLMQAKALFAGERDDCAHRELDGNRCHFRPSAGAANSLSASRMPPGLRRGGHGRGTERPLSLCYEPTILCGGVMTPRQNWIAVA